MFLIQKSGVYKLILNQWPPAVETEKFTEKWAAKMARLGEHWRELAGRDEKSLVAADWSFVDHVRSAARGIQLPVKGGKACGRWREQSWCGQRR